MLKNVQIYKKLYECPNICVNMSVFTENECSFFRAQYQVVLIQ